jgi:hypothetical protein
MAGDGTVRGSTDTDQQTAMDRIALVYRINALIRPA